MGTEKTPEPDELKILPQIEHVVYLMFENRSLDNLLGWLYEDGPPSNMVPPIPDGPQYDGLKENAYKLPLKPHFWSKVHWYPIKKGVGKDGFSVPSLDPHEKYHHVINQLFGDAKHTVEDPPSKHDAAPMLGFLQDFNAWWEDWDQTLQITETYTPADLPVINGLAKQYAVSDRWYCSMPTQTNPNRAFSLCGTSLGRLVNTWDAVEQFDAPTIWNALAEAKIAMGVYYHEIWHEGKSYTQYTFPNVEKVEAKGLLSVEKIDDPDKGFYALAKAGTLPAFSYIEPKWGYGFSRHIFCKQGNDYHPPTDVRYGEKLLYDVYMALRSNAEAWKKTLLIVTFDEHGGTYDHHAPAWGAVNPGDLGSKESPFKFDLYGVRVPMLLISPYVTPGTVFRQPPDAKYPFDHTATLATLLKWQGIDPAKAGLLNRVAVAPSFEGVLGDKADNPGANIPDPGASFVLTEESDAYADIPGSVLRYVSVTARTKEEADRLVQDYRENREKD